jgi:hypothetical protein
MDAPGITLRPIESMEGERKWSTVYLDNLQLTEADRVGAENEGWRIALDVLANERMSMSSTPGLLWGEGPSFGDLLSLVQERNDRSPLPDHLRQRVAQGYVEASRRCAGPSLTRTGRRCWSCGGTSTGRPAP